MNKEQLLTWLRIHSDVLKISAIGRRASIPNLNHILTGTVDGKGYAAQLADKHLPALKKEIERIRK